MIQRRFKAPVTAFITPICRALLRIGLSANAITVIGAAGATFSSIYFFARGDFFLGTLLVSLCALSDLLDGTMARISKTDGTRWGA
ncbi:MAG: CDP-alcohol phosphatidyltransferase family protein, partial [Actinomycetota bacterium]